MIFRTLLKKEFSELFRTYRLYIIPGLFLFFGLISPVVAKIIPTLFESMMPELEIAFPDPTWIDAFGQFFKNLTQMGSLIVILSSMGAVADEKARGTALLVLSRPVSRYSLVLSKFVALSVFLTGAILLSYLACIYNTWVLWPDVPVWQTLAATLLFIIYAIFLAGLTIFASSLAKSSVMAGGIALGGFFLFSTLPTLHRSLALYSPGALTGFVGKVTEGSAALGEASGAILVTLALTALLLILGSVIFNKQEL